jgi:hypothetical protein
MRQNKQNQAHNRGKSGKHLYTLCTLNKQLREDFDGQDAPVRKKSEAFFDISFSQYAQ